MIIGPVLLTSIEVPQSIDSLAAYQTVVVHDFPGGYRTIRNIGAFPKPLSWHGILSGPSAFDRGATLERLAVTGQTIVLSYGPITLQGQVVEFEMRPRQQFFIPYTIHFIPTLDLSGIISSPQQPPSADSQISQTQNNLSSQQSGTASTLPSSAGGVTPPSTGPILVGGTTIQ